MRIGQYVLRNRFVPTQSLFHLRLRVRNVKLTATVYTVEPES